MPPKAGVGLLLGAPCIHDESSSSSGATDLWDVPQVFLDYFNTGVLCGQLQFRTCGGDMKSTDLQPLPFP